MSSQDNIASQKAFGDAVNSGHLDAFESLVAADSGDHDPAPAQGSGPDGYRSFYAEMCTAFPDLHLEVEHLTAADDDVAFAYTVTGTQQGPLLGHAATGKAIKVRGMQISGFQDGKLLERWGSSAELGMLSQLGLVSP